MTDSLERALCATVRRDSFASAFTRFGIGWVTWGHSGSEAMGLD
jgi:hypothetical protein